MRALSSIGLGLIGATLMSGSVLAQEAAPAEKPDPLDLASGAVLLEFSSEYGHSYAAMGLIDGSKSFGWSSANGASAPHSFVFELPRTYALKTVTAVNEGNDEPSYPGISAKQIEVLLSRVGPKEGFESVAKGEAPKGGEVTLTLPEGSTARWLKLVIHSNWGEANYTELQELSATGEPVGDPPALADVAGVYATTYGLVGIRREGSQVTGCYYSGAGELRGSTDGRVISMEWRQDEGKRFGPVIMALASDGSTLNGLWYENGSYQGLWQGSRQPEGTSAGCKHVENPVAASLKESGKALLYGLYFDYDKATLKPESTPTLELVRQALIQSPSLKLEIGGHTDSAGDESYNKTLSQARAAAVAAWLTGAGITKERLTSIGEGETKPVADNGTPQGRALNRRVEVRSLE